MYSSSETMVAEEEDTLDELDGKLIVVTVAVGVMSEALDEDIGERGRETLSAEDVGEMAGSCFGDPCGDV